MLENKGSFAKSLIREQRKSDALVFLMFVIAQKRKRLV